MAFVYYHQLNAMDCGPTCLRMICKYYGKHFNASTLRNKLGFNKTGVSLLGISEIAETIGFNTISVQINYDKLQSMQLPAILHWNQNHFVVLISIRKDYIKIADPANGLVTYKKDEFRKYWISNYSDNSDGVGTVLLLDPTTAFYNNINDKRETIGYTQIIKSVKDNKDKFSIVLILLIIGSGLQFALPFLTKNIVDIGINTKNLHYITLVLIAQLALVFSNTVVGLLRNRFQLKISGNINMSILSNFWAKLTRLPLSYFDVHQVGDTMQRIGDNKKIQSFLTEQTLSSLLALINFCVYSIILLFYNLTTFIIFIIGSGIYYIWIQLFINVKRKINFETFYINAKENNATLQFVQGMQEIRLNNAEKSKRKEWDNIQSDIFKLNLKSLNYTQLQTTGALFISQGKDILISFFVAKLVLNGQLTFGTMLAIQYIIGQLNGPIIEFISASQGFQDAKISIERLNEIYEMEDEEPETNVLSHSLENGNISFSNLSFSYPGIGNEAVLKNINFEIPEGKTIAIVGTSGSGKTTLLKLLLKIYSKYEGAIQIGGVDFNKISPSFWRNQCGAVLQDSYIFNDTIARNIVVNDEVIDYEKLIQSCRIANILEYVETLPNGYETRLGVDGIGLSQGQKQRLLIARVIYKEPKYLFFDEATNSLDTRNEKSIVEKLQYFFEGRTAIVVAHRLSTIKNADKILLLEDGRITEEGTHEYLISIKGGYYNLVKSQLELG